LTASGLVGARPRVSSHLYTIPLLCYYAPLMKIKRLDILGFKSFVDKVSLDFQQPITGIVGPNGCGKSNIVDAIRWGMGEQ